jgi:hypothetical protein
VTLKLPDKATDETEDELAHTSPLENAWPAHKSPVSSFKVNGTVEPAGTAIGANVFDVCEFAGAPV